MPEKVGYLMYKTKTSLDKLFGAELFGWLFLLFILIGYPLQDKGQEPPDLRKPFKKCWEYGAKNGLFHVIASDNDSQLLISNSASINSVDPSTKLENWKSEISGQIKQGVISDDNSLFFLTEYEPNSELNKTEKIITLNSISLKTGITRWQEKIASGFSSAEIKTVDNKEIIFIVNNESVLSAVQKTNGSLLWKKDFSNSIISMDSTLQTEINVLTEDTLFRIKTKTGEILEEIKVENNSLKSSVVKENYRLTGNTTGEVIKIIYSEGKSRIAWKIKTGGSISNLMVLQEGILVTSLDNFIYLFSSEEGKLRWKRRVSGRITRNPLIFRDYAVVVNSSDSYSSVIDLRDGKVVNQIQIDDGNYFSGSPVIFRNFLVLQSYKGIYFFTNTDVPCQ